MPSLTAAGGAQRRLLDLARGSPVFDDVPSLYAALDDIARTVDVVRIKDGIVAPLGGCRDVLLNVRSLEGSAHEVQLHQREVFDVKMPAPLGRGQNAGRGHHLYQQVRDINRTARAEDRKLTEAEEVRIDELKSETMPLYDSAWSAVAGRGL